MKMVVVYYFVLDASEAKNVNNGNQECAIDFCFREDAMSFCTGREIGKWIKGNLYPIQKIHKGSCGEVYQYFVSRKYRYRVKQGVRSEKKISCTIRSIRLRRNRRSKCVVSREQDGNLQIAVYICW